MRRTLIALLPFFVMAGHASAADDRALSGPEVARMISGNTVQGAMAAGGPYREFYLPDGTLRGSNYDGRWSVVGNTLCFSYDAATPANRMRKPCAER